jgi:gliding motility-associated protein GldM
MALPKEPRQKMINIMYLVLTAILALNVSAEILEAFKTVDLSLQGSSTNIANANSTIYKSFQEKLKDEKYRERAAVWQPKAQKAQALSAQLYKDLEDLKLQLKNEAGLKMKDVDGQQVESFKEDNLDASTRLFETNKQGAILKQKLEDYKKAMIAIDPAELKQFEASWPISTADVVGKEGKKKEFTANYFHMTPVVAALTMLSKFQNNVKNAENTVVTHFHNKIGSVEIVYNQFAAIVGQSSNYVMPGEKMSITAGVGAFSTAAQPIISIGGSGAPVNADGVATREFTAEGAGNKTVPVQVTYTKPDGTKETKSYNIEYTVGVPGGAAVMLDKMNVFYIGVDNPVTIGSPTGWDKTSVSMSGGTISGTGSKRTVRVSSVGAASITVNADGKASTYGFRVKRIPDPIFKVGSGKIRMPSVEFKNQQFCRAELENFDFDLKYNIASATVYFSGANFPNVVTASIGGNSLASLQSFMQRCGPGSVISFDNIKVSGPDGTRSIEGKSIALY